MCDERVIYLSMKTSQRLEIDAEIVRFVAGTSECSATDRSSTVDSVTSVCVFFSDNACFRALFGSDVQFDTVVDRSGDSTSETRITRVRAKSPTGAVAVSYIVNGGGSRRQFVDGDHAAGHIHAPYIEDWAKIVEGHMLGDPTRHRLSALTIGDFVCTTIDPVVVVRTAGFNRQLVHLALETSGDEVLVRETLPYVARLTGYSGAYERGSDGRAICTRVITYDEQSRSAVVNTVLRAWYAWMSNSDGAGLANVRLMRAWITSVVGSPIDELMRAYVEEASKTAVFVDGDDGGRLR